MHFNYVALAVLLYILMAWFFAFLSKAMTRLENDLIDILIGLFWPVFIITGVLVIAFQILAFLLKIVFAPALLIGKIVHDDKYSRKTLRKE